MLHLPSVPYFYSPSSLHLPVPSPGLHTPEISFRSCICRQRGFKRENALGERRDQQGDRFPFCPCQYGRVQCVTASSTPERQVPHGAQCSQGWAGLQFVFLTQSHHLGKGGRYKAGSQPESSTSGGPSAGTRQRSRGALAAGTNARVRFLFLSHEHPYKRSNTRRNCMNPRGQKGCSPKLS